MAKKKPSTVSVAGDVDHQTELRVALSRQLIDDTRAVCWAITKVPARESLEELTKASVALRASLLRFRDDIPRDRGPAITDALGQYLFESFEAGGQTLLQSFMGMRAARAGDINWTKAREYVVGFQKGVDSLIDFLFVAQSAKSPLPLERNLFLASLDDSGATGNARRRTSTSQSRDKLLDKVKELQALGLFDSDIGRQLRADYPHLLNAKLIKDRPKYPTPSQVKKLRDQADARNL